MVGQFLLPQAAYLVDFGLKTTSLFSPGVGGLNPIDLSIDLLILSLVL